MNSILLIQIRANHKIADHEFDAIVHYSGLQPTDIKRVNAYTDALDPTILDNIRGVIIGGSGECNVSRREPIAQFPALVTLVQEIAQRQLPTIGLCYGGHLLAAALGGTVEYRPSSKEVGTVTLHRLATMTEDDPLLGDMPATVLANCGRTDDIIALPLTAVPLYNSDQVQYHVFKLAGLPIYGFQSHPELGRVEHIQRLQMSLDFGKYVDQDTLQSTIGQIQETSDWNTVLQRFVQRIVQL